MSLRHVFGEADFQEFIATCWPDEPFVSHGPEHRIDALKRIPALQSVHALWKHWQGPATAWAPLDRDEPAVEVVADRLPEFYNDGHTIYLTQAQRHIPELLPWLRASERDLGLARGAAFCEVLCSLKGQGAKVHFDPNFTANIQLRGRKTWAMARNTHIAKPPVGGTARGPLSPVLRPLVTTPFPDGMPHTATTFATGPGSVVCIPHGWWHSTECAEPSMAVLLTVDGRYWSSLLAAEAAAALQAQEVCRAIALLPPAGQDARAESRLQLQASLEVLKQWVNTLDAETLLRQWSGPPLSTFTRRADVDTNGHEPELIAWMDRQGGVFHIDDAIEAFAPVAPEAIRRRVWALVSLGILTVE
jgi:hypothetical protein